MLLSLVLALTPTEPFTVRGFYGRQARGWFLREVNRHDPHLRQKLREGNDLRPYTVSSLWCDQKRIVPGDVCYLRITSLDERLTELLQGKFLEKLSARIRIRDVRLEPLGRAIWHPWDAESTIERLMVRASRRELPERVTLHFASLTSFRSQGIDRPLPVPALVWQHLYSKWTTFIPFQAHIDRRWPRFAATGIAVSDFNLRSEKVNFKRGEEGAATGATGYVTYHLLPTELCGDYGHLREGAEAKLHLLGNFALFCGVGHHTTRGLGQVRAVADAAEADGRIMTPRYQNVKMG